MSAENNKAEQAVWQDAVEQTQETRKDGIVQPMSQAQGNRLKRAMKNLGELAKNLNESAPGDADEQEDGARELQLGDFQVAPGFRVRSAVPAEQTFTDISSFTPPASAAEAAAPITEPSPAAKPAVEPAAAPTAKPVAVSASPSPAAPITAVSTADIPAAMPQAAFEPTAESATPVPNTATPQPKPAAAQPAPPAQQTQQPPPQPPQMQQPGMPGGYMPYGAYPYGYPMYPPMMPMMPMTPPAGQDDRTDQEKQAKMRVLYDDEQDDNAQPQQIMPQGYGIYPMYPQAMPMYGMYPSSMYPQTEQFPQGNQPKKTEPSDEYLSGMQVLYESEIEEKAPEEAPVIDTDSIKELYEDLVHTAKPLDDAGGVIAADFSDLFEEAQTEYERKVSRSERFFSSILPWSGDSFGEKIRKTVLMLAILAVVCSSAWIVYDNLIEPRSSVKIVDEYKMKIINSTKTEKDIWDTIFLKYPDIAFLPGMQPKWAELYATNPDFRGWIKIENLGIDFPVMQRDNVYYLKHGLEGEYLKRGIPFFDVDNNIEEMSRNTTVFGHNLRKDDVMFGVLEAYMTIDGFKNAPVIQCDTIYNDYNWKIYAVFITNGKKRTGSDYLLNYIFSDVKSDAVFAEYIEELDRRRLYKTGVDILSSDKILTLSTCSYLFKDARLVVVARMVRPGESSDVDVSLAAENATPQYPQVYYDNKGIPNPYKDYEYWIPH